MPQHYVLENFHAPFKFLLPQSRALIMTSPLVLKRNIDDVLKFLLILAILRNALCGYQWLHWICPKYDCRAKHELQLLLVRNSFLWKLRCIFYNDGRFPNVLEPILIHNRRLMLYSSHKVQVELFLGTGEPQAGRHNKCTRAYIQHQCKFQVNSGAKCAFDRYMLALATMTDDIYPGRWTIYEKENFKFLIRFAKVPLSLKYEEMICINRLLTFFIKV